VLRIEKSHRLRSQSNRRFRITPSNDTDEQTRTFLVSFLFFALILSRSLTLSYSTGAHTFKGNKSSSRTRFIPRLSMLANDLLICFRFGLLDLMNGMDMDSVDFPLE
jgi:hypothetical protein